MGVGYAGLVETRVERSVPKPQVLANKMYGNLIGYGMLYQLATV